MAIRRSTTRKSTRTKRQRNGQPEQSELYLYIKNDGQLYRQQGQPIIKNLAAKKASGKYNSTLAVKLYGYLAESGAKKYTNEYARGSRWNDMFSVADRKAVAQRLRDDFEEEWNEGNYREYVPKKYQASVKANPQVGDYELTRKTRGGFHWKESKPYGKSGVFHISALGAIDSPGIHKPPAAVVTAAKKVLKGQA